MLEPELELKGEAVISALNLLLAYALVDALAPKGL